MPYAIRSEVRDGVKNELNQKVQAGKYGKYLKKINLKKVRFFEDCVVNFDFPVTAIIGPNGGGKTTILGAAGCVYKKIKPGSFFSKSGKLDDSMSNWSIEYEVHDKHLSKADTVRRTASFKNFKWKREALERDCVYFGVSRTVPATERVELKRFASPSYQYKDENIYPLDKATKEAIEMILGKDASGYNNIKIDQRAQVTLLSGSYNDITYSEFHFGAGESSIVRIVANIESLNENSLILIEEIENGLHPVATIRLVDYLIDMAHRKKSQVIFTTHSNDALYPLPDNAVWAAIGGKAIQGKLDVHSLRAITGQIKTELAIFVEDEFAKLWIENIIRYSENIPAAQIEIHALHGDGNAVKINKSHNIDPSTKFKSICFIDGDSSQQDSIEHNVYRLPGEDPESYIFDSILDNIENTKGLLSVSLTQSYPKQETISQLLSKIRRTCLDPHNLFSQVGVELGFLSESVAKNSFCYVWCVHNKEKVDEISAIIKGQLSII